METKTKNTGEIRGFLRLTGLVVTGVTVGLMTVLGPYLLLAQGTAGGTGSSGTKASFVAIDADCRIAIKPFIDKQQKEFQEFMQKTFANKSDNSVLIDIGVRKYRSFRKEILDHLNKHIPISGDVSENLTQQLACRKIAQDALITAENILRKHVRDTAQGKKTTKFVQKMQTLNKKLGELQREIGTFKGYMDSFSSKLPCYTAQCIK